ncbi:MAG TPA: hypothetical protein VMI56_11715 [Reyranella sp.]|nr:hypothetical protein [Reyranella sp.]
MNSVLLGVMLIGGGLAGWWGWRRATKTIYRRLVYKTIDPPPGMTRREYERSIRRRRKVMRVVVTILYTLSGALGGIVILMVIASRH